MNGEALRSIKRSLLVCSQDKSGADNRFGLASNGVTGTATQTVRVAVLLEC